MSLLLMIIHLLILCLSMHACTARPLDLVDHKELLIKDAKPSIEENLGEKGTLRVGIDEKITLASRGGVNTQKLKNSEPLGKRNEDAKGKDINALSSLEVMHKTTTVKDQIQRRQARIILESIPPRNAEESMYPKENDMGEDIVVMDYAQPHRKPPIHNREP